MMNFKKSVFCVFFFAFSFLTLAQAQSSCTEIMSYVKSQSYGTSYYSFNSEAISSVSFHSVTTESYDRLYFAIVQFKSSYKEYIYQVDSNTERNYLLNYQTSAGRAFFAYIDPYSEVLGCAPSF